MGKMKRMKRTQKSKVGYNLSLLYSSMIFFLSKNHGWASSSKIQENENEKNKKKYKEYKGILRPRIETEYLYSIISIFNLIFNCNIFIEIFF